MKTRYQLLVACSTVLLLALTACERPRPATPTAGAPPPPAPAVQQGDVTLGYGALPAPAAQQIVPGEVLVKFRSETAAQAFTARETAEGIVTTSVSSLDQIFQRFNVVDLEPVLGPLARLVGQSAQTLSQQIPNVGPLFIVKLPALPDESVAALQSQVQRTIELQQALAADPGTEYAELNYVAAITDEPLFAPPALTPNDPLYQYQWHMRLIQMEAAWDISQGENIKVAVIDTGVAYETFQTFNQAPDLSGTRFEPGYDFVNNDAHANDDNGHGTHVAGTIAQTTNNGQGVAGVAFRATVIPVKVLDAQGQGSYATIIQGITFAVDRGARVINLSMSGPSDSQALRDAVRYARQRGVLVVAAAGNRSGPVEFPAAIDEVLAVGSVRLDGSRAPYSNFGPQVDLAAPGGDNGVDQDGDGFKDGILQQTFRAGQVNNFEYLFFQGTSMAAPHVSGVAALLLSKVPTASLAEIENALFTTARDLGPAGRDAETGFGLVQAADALRALGAGPPTPTPTVTPTTTPGPPTPTPTPPLPGTELLRNGGFETNEAWIFGKTPKPGSYTSDRVHSGQRAVRLGIVDGRHVFSFSSVWQQVTIPAEARTATLTAWVYPISQNTADSDRQMVLVLNRFFQPVQFLDNTLSNQAAWVQRSYDLSGYRGQTIYVYFGVVNRGASTTSALYVDDVSLTWAK